MSEAKVDHPIAASSQPHPRHSSFWTHIDAVLAINLDSRPDRWIRLQSVFADIIPSEKLHRVPAVYGKEIPGFGRRPWFRNGKRDGTWAGRAGCTLSHRRAILKAKAAGWRSILVLEDDALPAPDFAIVADRLDAVLQDRHSDWAVCYLGFTHQVGPSRQLAPLGENHALHQSYGCLCTHAYLLRDTTYAWLLEQLPDESAIWPWLARHRAVDLWYSRNLSRRFDVLAVSLGIVAQESGHSDITGRASHDDDSALFNTTLPQISLTDAIWRRRHRRHSFRVRCLAACEHLRLRALRKRLAGF